MHRICVFLSIGLVALIPLANCSKSSKSPFLLLAALGQGSSTGGNEGVPSDDTTSDPIPTVTPQGTDQACNPIVPPPAPSVGDVLAQQPYTGDGTTTSPDMFVEKGVLVGNLNCGTVTRQDGTKPQVVLNGQINGTIAIKNVNGTGVTGATVIIGDDFLFIPTVAFAPNNVYTITFSLGGGLTFTENIFMAVDNTCMADSLFSRAKVVGTTTDLPISQNIVVDNNGNSRAIEGWDFSKGRFYMSVNNKTAGAKYVLTLYGVYDEQYHRCEVYYQRFASPPYDAVQNLDITGWGKMHVDETDTSIPKPGGGYYSFSKTYIELKVFDASNNEITATDGASVLLEYSPDAVALNTRGKENLPAFAKAPRFSNESSLVAFLGQRKLSRMILLATVIVGSAGLLMVLVFGKRRTGS